MFIELNDEPVLTFCNKKGSYKIRPHDNSHRLTLSPRRIYTNYSSTFFVCVWILQLFIFQDWFDYYWFPEVPYELLDQLVKFLKKTQNKKPKKPQLGYW